MVATPWFESALPAVRDELFAVAAAPPVAPDALAAATGVAPRPVEALRITGRDRTRFLHAMLSNDVLAAEKRGAGHGVRATLNNVQGRVVADVHLLLVDPEPKTGAWLALLEPGAGPEFVAMLERYVIAEKVRFEPTPLTALSLLGPDAARVLAEAGAPLPSPAPHAHAVGTVGGCPVRVLRHEQGGGPDDVLVLAAPEDAEAVRAALPAADATSQEREARRILAGLPRGGGDVTGLHIALEGGLKERAISFVKGCYIGQEVICRLDAMGTPARLLVRLEADAPVAPGDALLHDGREVGYVTSAVRVPGGAAALGYAKKRSNDAGTVLRVGTPDGPAARVLGPA